MKSKTNDLNGMGMLFKFALEQQLAKEGHTLQDLETAMQTQDTEKTAGLLKSGGGPLDAVKTVFDLAGNGALIGAGTAGLAGALVGGAGYGAYKGLKDSRQKVQNADAVRQRLDLARQELESQHAGA